MCVAPDHPDQTKTKKAAKGLNSTELLSSLNEAHFVRISPFRDQ
jgi:hypothetical protein